MQKLLILFGFKTFHLANEHTLLLFLSFFSLCFSVFWHMRNCWFELHCASRCFSLHFGQDLFWFCVRFCVAALKLISLSFDSKWNSVGFGAQTICNSWDWIKKAPHKSENKYLFVFIVFINIYVPVRRELMFHFSTFLLFYGLYAFLNAFTVICASKAVCSLLPIFIPLHW